MKKNTILHKSVAVIVGWWNAKPAIFEKAFDRKHNAIGFMRTAFALLVIVGHSYHLGGFGPDLLARFSKGQMAFGTVAVFGFFMLSGFLITASFVYSSSVWRYLWNRFLRIMPAFWVALVVVAFVFAPAMYFIQKGTLEGFLLMNAGGPIRYIINNFGLDIHQYNISSLTSNIPWPNAFNGSLWTLIYEAKGYLLIAFFGVFGLFKRRSKIVLVSTLMLFALYALDQAVPGASARLFPLFGDPQLLPLMIYFFAGSTWYLFRDQLSLNNKYVVLAAILYVLSLRFGFYAAVGPITFTYIIFYLATHFPIKSFDKYADFSYGIYIYAFPVQQLLAQLGVNKYGIVVYILTTTLLTLPLAVASYYLVEKPALRLKSAQLRVGRRRKK